MENNDKFPVVISSEVNDINYINYLTAKYDIKDDADGLTSYLYLDTEGLCLHSDGQVLKGDFTHLIHRLKRYNSELLVKASKIKGTKNPKALDATAGLGEDSFFLAAAGFEVTMYEKNPIIYDLLRDAIERGKDNPEIADVIKRMNPVNTDSIEAMKNTDINYDVVLLDPMFPERKKSALVKKKLQIIQRLEEPCNDEEAIIFAAMNVKPKKLIIKRPPKGEYLAGIKPDHSIEGKAVRFDVIVSPYDRIDKFTAKA